MKSLKSFEKSFEIMVNEGFAFTSNIAFLSPISPPPKIVTGFLLISINIGKFSITKYYSIKKLIHTGISKNYVKKSYNDPII